MAKKILYPTLEELNAILIDFRSFDDVWQNGNDYQIDAWLSRETLYA